ncbi:PREDICTED: fibrinogen-like protein 1 [Cyprinodon variegatus]|uniref:fibrinogen-like protein 1 n=1 Tax=Cyprinodon variegatus TaxID=28743 RepID=UPI000742C2BB|nr:PREDICTED: fibrinogen-like protein 1 [Cyprinodon variegatus]
MDCTQIRIQKPYSPCGVYEIQPAGTNARIKVYCEMRPADGWIVIQRRSGRAVSFNKGWAKYRFGFGSLKFDHWLGLENIHLLTKDMTKRWTLRVELWDHEGGFAFAEYRDFKLGDERTAYQLHVGTYSGNAGDALHDQNGSGFSTYDRDNDNCYPCIYGDIAFNKCTSKHGSGWWYSGCGSAALNGEWRSSADSVGWSSGLHWLTWKGKPYSAKATRMMIMSD